MKWITLLELRRGRRNARRDDDAVCRQLNNQRDRRAARLRDRSFRRANNRNSFPYNLPGLHRWLRERTRQYANRESNVNARRAESPYDFRVGFVYARNFRHASARVFRELNVS